MSEQKPLAHGPWRTKPQPRRKSFTIYVTPEAIAKLGKRAARKIREAVEAGLIS
jgi:hypothetical protein